MQHSNILTYRKKPKFKPMAGVANITVPEGVEPDIEMTVAEMLAVKKFLLFALEDIRAQLDLLSKQKLTIKQFKEAKDSALLLGEYLSGQIQQIGESLASPEARPDASA